MVVHELEDNFFSQQIEGVFISFNWHLVYVIVI
jgi:hypothetical protein